MHKKLLNGKTINATKTKGLSRTMQTQKSVAYLHVFLDSLPALQKLSLIVCSISGYLEECLSSIKNVQSEEICWVKSFKNFAFKLH